MHIEAIYGVMLLLSWGTFIIYWFISSLSAKRSVHNGSWWRWAWFRLVAIAVILVLIRIPAFDARYRAISFDATTPPLWGAVGIVLVALGIAFAIWARVYIGRNWGMPMSQKVDRELVTSGPYAYVRHPIYTGVITAMLGSGLVVPAWLIMLIVFGVYFIYSASSEEKMLQKEFPNTYPAYKKRTKMLIPFVF